jgi:hypothetical protein
LRENLWEQFVEHGWMWSELGFFDEVRGKRCGVTIVVEMTIRVGYRKTPLTETARQENTVVDDSDSPC